MRASTGMLACASLALLGAVTVAAPVSADITFTFCNFYPAASTETLAIQITSGSTVLPYSSEVPYFGCAANTTLAGINPGATLQLITRPSSGGTPGTPNTVVQFTSNTANSRNLYFATPCVSGTAGVATNPPTTVCYAEPSAEDGQGNDTPTAGTTRLLYANYAPGLDSAQTATTSPPAPADRRVNVAYEGQITASPSADGLGFGETGVFDLTPGAQGTFSSVSFLPKGAQDTSLNSAIASQTVQARFPFSQQVPTESLLFAAIVGLGTEPFPYRVFTIAFENSVNSLTTTSALICNLFAEPSASTGATYRFSIGLPAANRTTTSLGYKQCVTLDGINVPNIQQPNFRVPISFAGGAATFTDTYPLHYQAQQNIFLITPQFVNNLAPNIYAPAVTETSGTRLTIQGFQHRVMYMNLAGATPGTAQNDNPRPIAYFTNSSGTTLTPTVAVAIASNQAFKSPLASVTRLAIQKPVVVSIQAGAGGTELAAGRIGYEQLPKNGSTLLLALIGSNAAGVEFFTQGTQTDSTTSNAPPVSSSTGTQFSTGLFVTGSSSTGGSGGGGGGGSSSGASSGASSSTGRSSAQGVLVAAAAVLSVAAAVAAML